MTGLTEPIGIETIAFCVAMASVAFLCLTVQVLLIRMFWKLTTNKDDL